MEEQTTPTPTPETVQPAPVAPASQPPVQPVVTPSASKPPEEKGKTPLLVGVLIILLVLLGLGLIFLKPSFDSKEDTKKVVTKTATKATSPVAATASASKSATKSSK